MLKLLIFLCALCSTALCQEWSSRACMVNHLGYYTRVMQATISELENEIKWCNLKMDDISTPVDIELYNWHLVGRVNYTNGFLVSMEHIDLSNYLGSISTTTIDGVPFAMASLRGNLNLNQMKIGFDVDIDFEGHEQTRVTGVFVYRIVSWTYTLQRNLHTNETTVNIGNGNASGASARMEFMPASNLTEVASRTYFAYSSGNTFPRWGQDIREIILRKAQEIDFPEIRFDNQC